MAKKISTYVYFFFTLILLSLFFLNCQKEAKESEPEIEPKKVLVRVNKTVLSTDDFDRILDQQELPSDVKKQLIQEWIDTELLYQEANRLKLYDDPDVAHQIREVERYVLSTELLRLKVESQVQITEEELKAYYAAHPEEFKREEEERHIQAISFLDPRKSLNVYQKIKRGTSFDQLFSDYEGEDFGYIDEYWELSPEIAEAAFKMKAGRVSKPIETKFGIHIIRVNDRKPAGTIRDFEYIRTELQEQLSNAKYSRMLDTYLKELREKAEVEVNFDKLQ